MGFLLGLVVGVIVGYAFPKAVYAAYAWVASKITGA